MSLLTSDTVVLVDRSPLGGTDVNTFSSRLDVVLELMNNGSLGGGNGYGCAEHVNGLHMVEKRLAEVRACIRRMKAQEARQERQHKRKGRTNRER